MNITNPGSSAALLEEIYEAASLHPCGISFEEFMSLALYHPAYGYYSYPRPLGKKGDYFTSVSVGSCFGQLLARQIRQIHAAWGSPTPFCVIEQGAHSGELARNILQNWPELSYRLVEPFPWMREWQCETVHGLGADVQHVPRLQDLREANAVFLCNELLDAFPVRRLHFTGDHWEEWRVLSQQNALQLRSFPLEQTGLALPSWVPSRAPQGFTVEICPSLRPWLADLSSAMQRGVALIIDYGITREERLAPERSAGTLRAYRKHRALPNPLELPGETDLTAHVDFTDLIEGARQLGWTLEGFTDQAHFLTGVATPWLRSLEGQADLPLLRQFKTLTHPAMMGQSFKVVVLSQNAGPLCLDGFQFERACRL